MVVFTFLYFAALLTIRGHTLGALLDPDQILRFKPPVDKTDSGVEIDDLMPIGGGDEIEDNDKRQIKPPTDDSDLGEAIDEPVRLDVPEEIREDDEKDTVMEKRADYGKTLLELMPSVSFDTRYAPSDESYEHFAKKAAHEYTMDDVEQYERRNAIGDDKRWTRGIVPYQFSRAVEANSAETGQIYAGMKEWEQKTCISFRPYSKSLAQYLGHNQSILIRDDLQGCYSQVGKMGDRWGTPQTVSLQKPGCMHARVVMHELGHALGFHHEQTRKDRDRFVRVNLDNVMKNQRHNYEKVGDNYLAVSTPYDYLSIMQYGPDSFGKIVNGKPLETMVPINSCYKKLIGKARHLSYYDHKLMNTIYGCTKTCEAMRCGRNCYATKSGENKQCHCVCLDHSNNPCMGGSCFEGDKWTDCTERVKRNPAFTCTQYKEYCCVSCRGFRPNRRCPDGEMSSQCADWFERLGKQWICSHEEWGPKCCYSCL